jgi:hypothetical protein
LVPVHVRERRRAGWVRGGFDLSGRLGRRRHGGQNTGMAAGVKPRSRGAVRHFPQGFTHDDRPVRINGGGAGLWSGEKQTQPGNVGWGLSVVVILQVLLLRSSAAGYRNERDMICDKFLLHCEDERIGILIFRPGCCGLDTHNVAVVRPPRFPSLWSY